MKDMIKAMVQEMVAQSIKEVMAEMMGTTPSVAPAEVVAPVKKAPSMSREEFLAVEEPAEIVEKFPLDYEVVKVPCGRGFATVVKYNQFVPSDVWTVNHLAITANYGGKWSGKFKGYTFPDTATLRAFLNGYAIKTSLTDIDRQNVKAYKAERAKAKAEYYANLAK